MLHQLRPGDCVLANFLNTQSLETAIKFNTDGQLLMTVQEARQAAIRMRQRDGEDWRDIISPDSALSYSDVIRLFSNIHEIPPQQDDIMTVEGRRDMTRLQLAAIGVLEYLDTYKSGLCSVGLGYHSRSIRKLHGDNYALIDPMNPNGVEFMQTRSLMQFLATQMSGHPPNDNFFFFVRK
jgi:hypothetical protein